MCYMQLYIRASAFLFFLLHSTCPIVLSPYATWLAWQPGSLATLAVLDEFMTVCRSPLRHSLFQVQRHTKLQDFHLRLVHDLYLYLYIHRTNA
ncbi:hypothetical protein GGR52DRAFT_562776 [Hypoxylon sp. FL1284]|nr:hypothetical protein GGR52DRAFT_562776 [Hypoxylon sp. FL1284]